MRPYPLLTIALIGGLFMMAGCKKDGTDPNMPVMQLSSDNVTGKSGKLIETTIDISIPDGFKELVITKGVNLVPDNVYGTKKVTPTSTGNNQYQYKFTYTLSPDETDKLVGFNFRLTDNQGRAVEKDLTVNTVASAAQNIFSHKWLLRSKFQESGQPAVETITDCEKDDVFYWKRDSSITVNYGSSACTFDGFNVYDKWTLSDDEKTFKQVYHSLFDPTAITTETYTVRSVTKDRLVMTITLDLSWLGPPYTDHELFVYTYDAVP